LRRKPRKNIFADPKRVRKKRIFAAAFLAVAACFVLVTVALSPQSGGSPERVAQTAHTDGSTETAETTAGGCSAKHDAATPPPVADAPAPKPAPVCEVIKATVKSGQTATALLGDWLSPLDIHNLSALCDKAFPLSRMRVGRPYAITTQDEALRRFEYEIDNEEKLVIERADDGFDVRVEDIPYDVKTCVVDGTIESSLYGAVQTAGEHPALAVRLADIFAWDVDFIRDIREGDSFRAIVEKRYREGTFTGYGRIEAAEFVNRGDRFRGYLFADKNGVEHYYDETGKSLRKAFLKAPLSFTRISSGYSMSRLHPILKIRRPHQGIDYAAPRGTPIKAIGDGVIIKRARGKGAGNYIKIRHNSVYESVYMHMSRYAKGTHRGSRVKQGQVIGYVGATGYATGPHLDFRIKKNGAYVNPRHVKSPPANPVSKALMAQFQETITPLAAKLDSLDTLHAAAEDAGDVVVN
jgi:murein DD-endopeptidase MepM/ murein hydrolase activator NlpD